VVDEEHDSVIMVDELSKTVREYGLKALVSAEGGKEELRSQAWVKKKVTDIVRVKAQSKSFKIDGVLIGDKVGEVQYLAYDKLRAEGIKQQVIQPPNTEENEHEESSKVLFGQQQETLGLGLTRDG
jgi:pimeloyl-CoA synthetase